MVRPYHTAFQGQEQCVDAGARGIVSTFTLCHVQTILPAFACFASGRAGVGGTGA